MTELTVVMPAYNEGGRIYRNLMETAKQLSHITDSFRIICVDDGSSDETASEAKRAAADHPKIGVISYPKNRGKGYAVRRGILASRSRYTAFLDADLDLPPFQLDGFLRKMKETDADMVIGSKMHPDSKVEYPFLRRVMSFGYYILMKILFRLPIRDTQTGCKLFRTDRIKPVLRVSRAKSFSFDIELLAIGAKFGYRIEEMPVVVNFSRGDRSRSKIRFSSIFTMAVDALKVKRHVRKVKSLPAE